MMTNTETKNYIALPQYNTLANQTIPKQYSHFAMNNVLLSRWDVDTHNEHHDWSAEEIDEYNKAHQLTDIAPKSTFSKSRIKDKQEESQQDLIAQAQALLAQLRNEETNEYMEDLND